MLMPMVWTNDFDEYLDPYDEWLDPFDPLPIDPFEDMVTLVETKPTKEEIETAKSIERHDKKLARSYNRQLRHSWNDMRRAMKNGIKKADKFLMKSDVLEEGDHFTIKAELPGFDKKDISIGLKNGILSVSATHKEDSDEKNAKSGKFICHELVENTYQRNFRVGEEVRPEEIQAKYENGILRLTVPNKSVIEKKEDVNRIEVK